MRIQTADVGVPNDGKTKSTLAPLLNIQLVLDPRQGCHLALLDGKATLQRLDLRLTMLLFKVRKILGHRYLLLSD
jgi:hypothetical protein